MWWFVTHFLHDNFPFIHYHVCTFYKLFKQRCDKCFLTVLIRGRCWDLLELFYKSFVSTFPPYYHTLQMYRRQWIPNQNSVNRKGPRLWVRYWCMTCPYVTEFKTNKNEIWDVPENSTPGDATAAGVIASFNPCSRKDEAANMFVSVGSIVNSGERDWTIL